MMAAIDIYASAHSAWVDIGRSAGFGGRTLWELLELSADGVCSGVEVDMPSAKPQCLALPQAEGQGNALP